MRSFVPAFRGPGKDGVTIRQLLTHTGGLLWWAPLFREISGRSAYVERIARLDLAYEPGTRASYSDLGIILLGNVLEGLGGAPLDVLARERVLEPLGMADTLYRPPAGLVPRIAPTEHDPWRGRLLRGEVHDENASALGGVAPHAGLFGSAPDLARFAQALLDGGTHDGRRLVSRSSLQLFTRRAGMPGVDAGARLGHAVRRLAAGAARPPASPATRPPARCSRARSFGHTGFTGTSLWLDPERGIYVVLLSNRVHPTRENDRIRGVRARLADAVVRAVEG